MADNEYTVVFTSLWGERRETRATLDEALVAVVELENTEGLEAEKIMAPGGSEILRAGILVHLAARGILHPPAEQEVRPLWTIAYEDTGSLAVQNSFAEQLDALKYISTGEVLGAFTAISITSPTGYVLDRAGIDAALERNGLVSK